MNEELRTKLKRIHCPGLYCETAMIRDVLELYGLRLSGNECLGLAGILGFAFVRPDSHLFELPHCSVTGIPYNAIVPLMVNLNLQYAKFENQTFDDAVEGIKYYLKSNIPVIIRVAYNQYYSKVFKEQQHATGNQGAENIFSVFSNYLPYNTGTHYILAIDYHEENDTIEFVENLFRGSYEMNMETLKKAMNSGQKMCAENEWTVIYPFDNVSVNHGHVYKSLRRIVNGMESSIDYNNEAQNGLFGLKEFIDDFFLWDKKFDKQTQLENMALLFLSGGGIYKKEGFYRNSFSKYLVAAEKITNVSELGDACALYKNLATKWDTFLGYIKFTLSDSMGDIYSDHVKSLLDDIYDDESKGAELLKRSMKRMW
ncbi:MAG: hypothetical protein KIC94_13570 [Clostridiales bacterium]|nr:BtrH N-terminal domain-containing protein [uncultured Anaerosporobacter sp.]MBS5933890.1 hypothetical protein [Clostridiales bacterium]